MPFKSITGALLVVLSLAAARPALAQIPTTVITDTMIADIGARSLKDVLLTYVPGLTFSQDHNEVNVAMRGVYGSSQQKLLVLVDGHALNMRSYSAANPDFSISVDRIARIEVLRGPASFIYGNGALAGVIRISTKTSAGSGESMFTAGIGNFGQRKATGLFGAKTDQGTRVFAWGQVYHSDGQTVSIPAGGDYSRTPSDSTAILDGFRGPASHDAGVTIATAGFTVSVAHRYSKYTEPFSAGGATGESYVYADYQPAVGGIEPGLGIGALNVDLSGERTFTNGWTGRLQAYFDRNDSAGHLIADPSAKAHALIIFREWVAGAIVDASTTYNAGGRDASLTVGGQVDVMRLHDSLQASGTGGGWQTTGPVGGLLELGDERVYSVFGRTRHPLTDKWTAHAGARVDIKARHDGENVHTLSPHAAVTYVHDDRTQVTASYASSFVDAPYFYRFTTLASYRGARTLEPEYLRSFQISPSTKLANGVTYTANFFFNHLDDLVWRNKFAGPTQPIYQNAGHFTSWGLEHEATYALGEWSVNGNLTYQRAGDTENYDVSGGQIHNVPNWFGNAVANFRPEAMAEHDVLFNLTARFIGSQLSPIGITIGNRAFVEPDRRVDAVMLINLGMRAAKLWGTPWLIDARVFNVFDTAYEQGGSVPHPYPQAGRSVMLTVGRSF